MMHRGDTRFAHIHIPALPTCSQIAGCIDIAKVDVDQPLCVRAYVHWMRAPCPRVFIVHECPHLPALALPIPARKLWLRTVAMLPLFA